MREVTAMFAVVRLLCDVAGLFGMRTLWRIVTIEPTHHVFVHVTRAKPFMIQFWWRQGKYTWPRQ